MNMVTQIIYLGRMEVGDWYYAFCLKKILSGVYGSFDTNHIFSMEVGELLLRSLFKKK